MTAWGDHIITLKVSSFSKREKMVIPLDWSANTLLSWQCLNEETSKKKTKNWKPERNTATK